jgi:hypothetical protein
MKGRPIFAAMILLTLVILACGSATPASSPPNVETVVAATFQALTVAAPVPEASQPAPQNPSTGILPRALYFLNNDSVGIAQVYRLEKDGKTVKQITFEPAKVEHYDVSQKDGSVVYVSNNQMLLVNADGSNRRMLLDGGPRDENQPFFNAVTNPVFSPNNETIAYGFKGLNFYSLVTGQSNLLIKDDIEDVGNGMLVPREMYRPEQYSADGTKLIITLGYYEGASAAIYYPSSNALVRLSGVSGALICCGDTTLTADGSLLYAAYPLGGMFSAGLWRVDTMTGKITTLLKGFDSDPSEVADNPYFAPDGNLYFFYTSLPKADEMKTNRLPLQLVRSKMDGVTDRTVLRPETYENMNEALWAPDGSFVIVAVAQIPDSYEGGLAQLVYTDGQKGVISLIPYMTRMKWGP